VDLTHTHLSLCLPVVCCVLNLLKVLSCHEKN
jgi:hypothetical protein